MKMWKIAGLILVIVVVIASVTAYYVYVFSPSMETQAWLKTLYIGSTEPFESMDFDVGYASMDAIVPGHLCCDNLWQPDPVDPAAYHNHLCEWEETGTASDGRSYVDAHLRQGLFFQDGEPITAQAIYDSFKREWEVNPRARWAIGMMCEDYEVVDEYTFRMYVPGGFLPFVFNAGSVFAHVGKARSNASVIAYEAGERDTIAGSGPFMVADWEEAEYIKLVAWEEYATKAHRSGMMKSQPKIDEVIITFFGESNSMCMALEKGDIDIAWETIDIPLISKLKNNPDIELMETPGGYTRFLEMTWKEAPYNNIKVRQAVAYAIDISEIIDKVYFNTISIGKSLVHEEFPYYDTVFYDTYKTDESNIDKAKELLAEAGYSDGMDLEFTITGHFATIEQEEKMAVLLQEQLRKVDINLEIVKMDWAAYNEKHHGGEVPMCVGAWKYDFADPDSDLIENSCTVGRADTWYGYNLTDENNHERVDELLMYGRELWKPGEDDPERESVYREVQALLAEDCGRIPFWHAKEYQAIRTYVKGYTHYWNAWVKPLWSVYKETPAEGQAGLISFGPDMAKELHTLFSYPGLMFTPLLLAVIPVAIVVRTEREKHI